MQYLVQNVKYNFITMKHVKYVMVQVEKMVRNGKHVQLVRDLDKYVEVLVFFLLHRLVQLVKVQELLLIIPVKHVAVQVFNQRIKR